MKKTFFVAKLQRIHKVKNPKILCLLQTANTLLGGITKSFKFCESGDLLLKSKVNADIFMYLDRLLYLIQYRVVMFYIN